MKLRSGFVSNSSSSSFIIIYDTKTPCPHCGQKAPEFKDFIEKAECYNSDNHVISDDAIEILDMLQKDLKRSNEEYSKSRLNYFDDMVPQSNGVINRIVKFLADCEDKKILYFDLSQHDDHLLEMLENPNIEVVYKTID